MTFRILETPISGRVSAKPASISAWQDRCRSIGSSAGDWLTPLRPAFGSGAHLLDRVVRANGVIVTTGQQPGLFGGPMYTWLKALATLEMAAHIERTTGVAAAPVFWAATDDADFPEAASTVITNAGGAQRLSLSQYPPEGVPMSFAALGSEATDLYSVLRGATGRARDARPLDAAEAFRPGVTIGDAYVTMLRALLEPLGIAVLDASHASVGAAAHAHLVSALERASTVHDALVQHADARRAAGESAPVETDRALALVFAWEPGTDALPRKRRLGIGEMPADVRLSPNVLLRPVIERLLLPTSTYLAGPGELAYFTQVEVVARALGTPVPLALPRWSGMIVSSETDELLATLKLGVDDLRDPHSADARVARATLPPAVVAALTDLQESLNKNLDQFTGTLPLEALDGVRGQFAHRIERLERRIVAAAKHRNASAMRQVAAARGRLFPFGSPQERALNVVPMWAAFGDELIAAIRAACARHAATLVA